METQSKECIVCGTTFYKKCTGNVQWSKQKHCSKKCNIISFGRAGSAYNKSRAVDMPKTKVCVVCGGEFGMNGRRGLLARGKAVTCSRGCAIEYRKLQPYKKSRRLKLIKKGKCFDNRRMIVFARDDFTCQLCGLKEPMIMQVDHKIEKAIDPKQKNALNNLRTLCPNCHARKTESSKSPTGVTKKIQYTIPRVKLLQDNPEFLKELLDKN